MHKKIGILGGTFDPIHNGHLAIAEAALQELNLDEVQFIPCHVPPHRSAPLATSLQRVEMVQRAIHHHAQFVLNTLEIQRIGPSYTIDTLIALQQPETTLYFITGADSYLTLATWHRAQEIPQYCNIIVYNRPGFVLPKKIDNATVLAMPPCAISATEIRAAIKKGEDISHWVPKAVQNYIQQQKLY